MLKGLGDDKFYLFISASEQTVLCFGTDLHYNYSFKKMSFKMSDFVSPEGSIHCNVDITNSLLYQNKCLPKCCKSKTTDLKHEMYVLWECKEKDDVSSE